MSINRSRSLKYPVRIRQALKIAAVSVSHGACYEPVVLASKRPEPGLFLVSSGLFKSRDDSLAVTAKHLLEIRAKVSWSARVGDAMDLQGDLEPARTCFSGV